jgi:hypothetical protein
MAFKDSVHGGKIGVPQLNVPHTLAHGTCGITYLVYTPSCLHKTFRQPSGFSIAIVVLMHGPAQNTAGCKIHTCLTVTK